MINLFIKENHIPNLNNAWHSIKSFDRWMKLMNDRIKCDAMKNDLCNQANYTRSKTTQFF